jgi:DNA helicase-2/ATP-dependent DNA helicase PcrA
LDSHPHAGPGTTFTEELNAEQLAVVTAPGGPVLVVAGAGSGKTRALTYRIAWLVEQGVDPQRIMLLTFTNRAAREMLYRVELLLQHDITRLWGGTFHHIANRILRVHGKPLGIAPDFIILDREDTKDLLSACIAELDIKTTERRFPNKSVLAAISGFVQSTLDPLETVLARRYPMFLADADRIRQVLDLYAVKKARGQLLDFDDLLRAWLELLEQHREVRELLVGSFDHVLVDEYQDTNRIQGRIVDVMAERHRNVCVVGDDAQSIYSFRGATFDNIITFQERYADASVFRLETNYRSTPEILGLANASIQQNRKRLKKELHAVRRSGLRPALVVCADHRMQSQFIAAYILHLLDEGRKLNNMAILYRSHWHSMDIQLEFQRRNIPFQVRGGLRFFEQAHIKDVLAYLRLLHNGFDELAWRRLLPQLPGVGLKTTHRLWLYLATAPDPLAAAATPEAENMMPARSRRFYAKFTELLKDLDRAAPPAELIDTIVREFYGDYLNSNYDNASTRRDDLDGVATFAAQYNSLEAFLADVALASEFAGENVVTGPDDDGYVVLSTVHQAKGLEWPVVFVPWLAEGRFPSDKALSDSASEEEERRIFHVAVTRAEDELYLTVPRVTYGRGQGRIVMKPSRFITEIDAEIMEPMQLTGQTGISAAVAGAPPERRRPKGKSKRIETDHADGVEYDYDDID